MAKDNQKDSKLVGQHKRIAMGEKVTGMKHGGAVKKAEGGMACKKGGSVKKK